MEQTTMEEPKRPTFLSVLCILTFVGVGFMLLFSLLGAKSALTAPSPEELAMQEQGMQMLQAIGGDEDSQIAESFQAAEVHKTLNWTLGFGGNILTLISAIMMWKLKKIGFYLYVVVELVPTIVSLCFGGAAAITTALTVFGMGEVGVGVIIAILFIFDIAFIIMYAVNLKHMN